MGVRVAMPGDKAHIFALLKACAGEIPVDLDGAGVEGPFRDIIDGCCQNGASFVAEADERIVGFLLTTPNGQPEERERILEYGCVASGYRGRRIFPLMLDEAKATSLRLVATVNDSNKCDMADRLVRDYGFKELGRSRDKGRAFGWLGGPGGRLRKA
jgi:hypothetical protein